MKQVTRWYCEHCKKDFKTPNRHFCFRDPDNRACATCQGWQGYEDGHYQDSFGDWNQERYAICGITDLIINDYSGKSDIDFDAFHGNRGYKCPHWKLKDLPSILQDNTAYGKEKSE